jgi:hypothetical protein
VPGGGGDGERALELPADGSDVLLRSEGLAFSLERTGI